MAATSLLVDIARTVPIVFPMVTPFFVVQHERLFRVECAREAHGEALDGAQRTRAPGEEDGAPPRRVPTQIVLDE
jgi:hypothetical protein